MAKATSAKHCIDHAHGMAVISRCRELILSELVCVFQIHPEVGPGRPSQELVTASVLLNKVSEATF